MFEKWRVVLVLVSCAKHLLAEMEGYIVGGEYAMINSYPHSAFLSVSCVNSDAASYYICGASIINQHFTLTAAHCLEDCYKGTRIDVTAGNENKQKGLKTTAVKFKMHEKYNDDTMSCDIGLIKVSVPFSFSANIKRVALPKATPFSDTAFVAGWGIVNEKSRVGTNRLKHTDQILWTRKDCMRVIRGVPVGAICAGYRNADHFAAEGDSGSALVIRNYLQVGIVSYKVPTVSNSLTVYTEVAYFLPWIEHQTKSLFCG